jgi:hypothetical protein
MENKKIFKWLYLFCTIFILSTSSVQAQINPLLLKDEAEIYPLVYFGMSLDEFKQKLSTRIFECKPNPNKTVADSGCKISLRFAGSGMSEGIGLFKSGKMVAFIARINTDFYPAVTQAVQSALGGSPQVESKGERKGFFSGKIENEYSIWSYPNYQMIISKFDIQRYEENGANFSLIVESDNTEFNQMMKEQSRKRSDIQIRTSEANAAIGTTSTPSLVTNSTPSNISSEVVKSDSTVPDARSNSTASPAPESKPANPPAVQPKKLRSKIEKKYDEFKKVTDYYTPSIEKGYGEVYLHAMKSDEGPVTYRIYVDDVYTDNWKFLVSGWDSDGNSLDVREISRGLLSCTRILCFHEEKVSIMLTKEYLEKYRSKGLRFKLTGKGGEDVFTIPAAHVDSLLEVVN